MYLNKFIIVLITTIIIYYANAIEVDQCEGSRAEKLNANEVKISKCEKRPCILKRRTNANIEMKFTAKHDFKTLRQDIQGIILGVPLPFPGVYDTDACPFIYDESGENKVGCPLQSGKTYIYRNGFKVLQLYPTIDVVVHWGLSDKIGGEDAVCFRIPAKIK